MHLSSNVLTLAPLPGPGNVRFSGSGRPRGPRRPFQKVGGEAPQPLKGSPGHPGPARLQKSFISESGESGPDFCFVLFEVVLCRLASEKGLRPSGAPILEASRYGTGVCEIKAHRNRIVSEPTDLNGNMFTCLEQLSSNDQCRKQPTLQPSTFER